MRLLMQTLQKVCSIMLVFVLFNMSSVVGMENSEKEIIIDFDDFDEEQNISMESELIGTNLPEDAMYYDEKEDCYKFYNKSYEESIKRTVGYKAIAVLDVVCKFFRDRPRVKFFCLSTVHAFLLCKYLGSLSCGEPTSLIEGIIVAFGTGATGGGIMAQLLNQKDAKKSKNLN